MTIVIYCADSLTSGACFLVIKVDEIDPELGVALQESFLAPEDCRVFGRTGCGNTANEPD